MKRYDLMTPEGTRDLLFDESVARRTVENRLDILFQSWGYSEVITPGIEFYDVFCSKRRYFSPESMYKLTDNKGRLIVIRPDSTMPIARLVATRLKDEPLPLKLYYMQNVFRVNPKDAGRDDEITQSGIEIVGGDTRLADFEALTLALQVLSHIDCKDFRFEIGDCGFYKRLISALPVDETQSESIRTSVESKNYPELKMSLEKYSDYPEAAILAELPYLFGGEEVFEKARHIFKDKELLELLDRFYCLYKALSPFCDNLSVDFSMVNKTNYYTGVIFNGYIEGLGMPVLSGGRYDTLVSEFGESMTAIGFAVNVNAAAKAVLAASANGTLTKPADVLVHCGSENRADGILHMKKLVDDGKKVELSLFEDISAAEDYAKAKGIKYINVVHGADVKILAVQCE